MRPTRTMAYHVAIAESVDLTVLELRRTIRADSAGEHVAAGLRELYRDATAAGLTPTGPPSTTYLDASGPAGAAEVELVLPIDSESVVGAVVRRLPSGRYAYTTHHGDYRRITEAYRALGRWMMSSGYCSAGPVTEVYLVGPDDVLDPHALVTEIRIPVTITRDLAVRLRIPFPDAVELVRKALSENGFGVLTEIDVAATLRSGIAVEMEDYVIIGACDPQLAGRALDVDRRIGALLPCNVVVRADGPDTLVEIADPTMPAQTQPQLRGIAEETAHRLAAVLDSLR